VMAFGTAEVRFGVSSKIELRAVAHSSPSFLIVRAG